MAVSDEKIKILMVVGAYPPMQCGVADYTKTLCQSLVQAGAQVGVLTNMAPSQGPQVTTESNVTVMRVVRSWKKKETLRIAAQIKAWQPSVIHVQVPSLGYDGQAWATAAFVSSAVNRIPSVFTFHEYLGVDKIIALPAIWASKGMILVRPNFNPMPPRKIWNFIHRPKTFIPNGPSLPKAEHSPQNRTRIIERFNINPDKMIVANFGFIHPGKGTCQLFEIANPKRDHLVVIGSPLFSNLDDPYYKKIVAQANSEKWRGNCSLAGFLGSDDAALILANADAILLPYTPAGGIWNTATHSAMLQETFVITTCDSQTGYDPNHHIYRTNADNIQAMAKALDEHVGIRAPASPVDIPTWEKIAQSHLEVYAQSIRK